MDDNRALLDVLATQAAIGRTGKGWDLGEGMLGASRTSADAAGKEGFSATECRNCGCVLSSEFFASGCPNCGCKDTKDFGEKTVTVADGRAGGIVTGELHVRPGAAARFYLVDNAQRIAKEQP